MCPIPAAREFGNAARGEILADQEKKRGTRSGSNSYRRSCAMATIRNCAPRPYRRWPSTRRTTNSSITAAPPPPCFAIRPPKIDWTATLVKSDSLRGDMEARDRAYRIRDLLDRCAESRAQSSGTPNWLSGNPVAEGIYYCPVSAAFQPPIDTVTGYKLKMNFQWDGNRLTRHRLHLRRREGLAELSRAWRRGRSPRQFLRLPTWAPIRKYRWHPLIKFEGTLALAGSASGA